MMTAEQLRNNIAQLKERRKTIEISDDYAFTNGRWNQITMWINEAEKQLAQLEKKGG